LFSLSRILFDSWDAGRDARWKQFVDTTRFHTCGRTLPVLLLAGGETFNSRPGIQIRKQGLLLAAFLNEVCGAALLPRVESEKVARIWWKIAVCRVLGSGKIVCNIK
jgi:hypothetical protein